MPTRRTNNAAVKKFQVRLLSLTKQMERLYAGVSTWPEKRVKHATDPNAAEAVAALYGSYSALVAVQRLAGAIDPAWSPPRAPPVRKYRGLKVGDYVVVAERYCERTPMQVRSSRLRVVEDDGDILSVEIVDGVVPGRLWGLERRVLVAAPVVTV